jgi:hypothetical protein
MRFEVICVRNCWGELRVSYVDESGALRSIPLSWTDRGSPDVFLEVSAGRSIVHPKDFVSLRHHVELLKVRESTREGP